MSNFLFMQPLLLRQNLTGTSLSVPPSSIFDPLEMTKTKPITLGNQDLLTKIDKLRETNVGAIIPLPQVRNGRPTLIFFANV